MLELVEVGMCFFVYVIFDNGLVYGFVLGVILDEKIVRDEIIRK